MTNLGDDTLSRIDRANNQVVSTLDVDDRPCDVVTVDDFVYVLNGTDGTVNEISAEDELFLGDLPAAPFSTGMAAGAFGDLWVGNSEEDTVTRLDLVTFTQDDIVDAGAGPLRRGGGTTAPCTYRTPTDGTITMIDEATHGDVIDDDRGGGDRVGIGIRGRQLWVANSADGTLSLIVNGEVQRTIEAGTAPVDVAPDGTELWVSDQGSDSVLRLDPGSG